MHATIIGGGFYGCCLAVHLATKHEMKVDLYERESDLMMRASRVNQARVHSGLHYPRSMQTASRCVSNLPRFCATYPQAIYAGFRALYAIPKEGSLVTPKQFEDFALQAGIPLWGAEKAHLDLFDLDVIDTVYVVQEPSFNIDALRRQLKEELFEAGVHVHLGKRYTFKLSDLYLTEGWIFDCSYSAIEWSEVGKLLTEVCLIKPPAKLENIGITVMDGPFFSVMPFPKHPHVHSLTDVEHTVHEWNDLGTNFELMRDKAEKYVPCMREAQFEASLFDVKALLKDTEGTSARPVMVRRGSTAPNIVSIVGSKMDNVFDCLDLVDAILDCG